MRRFPSSRTGIGAVPDYNKKTTLKITFKISRHSARTTGEKIRKKRLMRDLKQGELAEIMGVNEMTVVNWEAGKTDPREGKYRHLVNDFLQCRLGTAKVRKLAEKRLA